MLWRVRPLQCRGRRLLVAAGHRCRYAGLRPSYLPERGVSARSCVLRAPRRAEEARPPLTPATSALCAGRLLRPTALGDSRRLRTRAAGGASARATTVKGEDAIGWPSTVICILYRPLTFTISRTANPPRRATPSPAEGPPERLRPSAMPASAPRGSTSTASAPGPCKLITLTSSPRASRGSAWASLSSAHRDTSTS